MEGPTEFGKLSTRGRYMDQNFRQPGPFEVVKVKVKQYYYMPGQALMVPGG
jgi:hypothetical protein